MLSRQEKIDGFRKFMRNRDIKRSNGHQMICFRMYYINYDYGWFTIKLNYVQENIDAYMLTRLIKALIVDYAKKYFDLFIDDKKISII
jgi:hypothetical protein